MSDADPAFLLEGYRELSLPSVMRTAHSAEWFAHRVARLPRDLLAHVQRIRLLADLGDGPGACGALHDLGLALGGAGRGLRDRLLADCGGALAPGCRDALADGASGHRHGLSVLDGAIDGRLDLVSSCADSPRYADAVALAEAELALGNLAGSRELLEAAMADPATAGRARALLATIDRAAAA